MATNPKSYTPADYTKPLYEQNYARTFLITLIFVLGKVLGCNMLVFRMPGRRLAAFV